MIYTDKIIKAIHFASSKHRDQKRKILGYPYISHPLCVLFIVSHYTNDENVLVSSILHDTVEDTDASLDEIEAKFGRQVRDNVDVLTDDDYTVENKIIKQKQLEKFAKANHDVLLIKLADIINNFCDIVVALENYSQDVYVDTFGENIKERIVEAEERLNIIEKAWTGNPLIKEARSRFENYKNALGKLSF